MASGSRNGEIELVSVTKRFGDTVAVDAVSLRIPQGAYCCLLGPSGCGKTTILRMIAGHETPSQGDIRIGGESVVGQPPVRRGTAMMFQAYALFPHLSVLDNVAFSLKMRGLDRAARQKQARELLSKVRLDLFADRLPAQLSGGQQGPRSGAVGGAQRGGPPLRGVGGRAQPAEPRVRPVVIGRPRNTHCGHPQSFKIEMSFAERAPGSDCTKAYISAISWSDSTAVE